MAVGLLWFLCYAAYSSSVRKVDPGLGDIWAVPLRHGYFFCMIDVPDSGYLMKHDCSGVPPIADIRELAEVGDVIVGSSGQSGFVFDTRTGDLKRRDSTAAALAQFSPPPKLQTSEQFYRTRRFGWQDLVALAILLGVVAAISWLWFAFFIRMRSAASTTEAT